MSLIPKISQLLKLPELVKYKQKVEARDKSRKEYPDDNWIYYDPDDEVTIDPDKISKYKVENPSKEPRKAKSADDDNIGRNIDLKI